MNNKKQKINRFIFSWHSNWRFKSFALGLNFASEQIQILDEGATYEMLNYDVPVPVIYLREYYLMFHLGFWQLSIGFTVKSK